MSGTSEEKERIIDIVGERSIAEVVHFTTNLGLTGCMHVGSLMPRSRLAADAELGHILTLNAPFRMEERVDFDKSENWIDYVNMSISEITTNLFRASLRWHTDKDIFWVVLGFDPQVIAHNGVYFATTNNIYQGVKRAKGPDGLEALFAPVVHRRGAWYARRNGRAQELPTCEQAEVLYPGPVSLDHLRTIYVSEGEHADWAHMLLRQFDRQSQVAIKISPDKFKGQSN